MSELGPLGFGQTWPTKAVFEVMADERRIIPVVRRLIADGETPVSLYRKLAGSRPGTFLLESAEQTGLWSRYSIVGVRSRATLTERDGEVVWLGDPPAGAPTEGNALDALHDIVEMLHTPAIPGMPPLTGGMVGAIGYDAVRHWERVPDELPDALGLPVVTMLLSTDLAVLDHQDGSVMLIANAIMDSEVDLQQSWHDALQRLDAMAHDLVQPAPATVAALDPYTAERMLRSVTANVAPGQFLDMVDSAKEDIRSGEVFQVVLSQRFSLPTDVAPLDVYRALRTTNPSPYMYLFRLPHVNGGVVDVVGSSPEALVRVEGRRVITHPIAGTRPRGKTPEDDVRLAEDLLADEKERAEHVMLVDLGRNDLQRVSTSGSVEVVDFLTVRHYSHVMHLESTIVGQLQEETSAFDALVATFPAGTLSGAPKPRAMELIERYEVSRRGIYGGVVGYLDFHGDMDMAIAIRTVVLHNGMAHVQAGAGIVADSNPHSEYEECVNKAAAALRAVAAAAAMTSP